MYNCVWFFCIYLYGLSLYGWHAVFCITNNRRDFTITMHTIERHFLIWMTTVRQPTKRRWPCVLTLKYTFISAYWWTRQIIHNTLVVVGRYLQLMGNKTIPDSAEPRLESFYPPWIAGIDLPHQGAVDSYSLREIARSCVNTWRDVTWKCWNFWKQILQDCFLPKGSYAYPCSVIFLWSEMCIWQFLCVWVNQTYEHTSLEMFTALKDCDQKEMIGFNCICLQMTRHVLHDIKPVLQADTSLDRALNCLLWLEWQHGWGRGVVLVLAAR